MHLNPAHIKDAALYMKAFGECAALGFGILAGQARQRPHHQRLGRVADTGSSPPVAVIGGAGYIGSVLVRKLLCRGRKVRILDKLVYGDEAIRGIIGHPNLELIVGDCRDVQDVTEVCRSAGAVVHLAAIVGDPACLHAPKSAIEINCAATRILIEIAKGSGVERFVFASSCSVYGASDSIMHEDSQTRPVSLYAETKVDCERMLLNARSDSFQPTILRLATVFGDSYRPRFDLAVNLLAAKAHSEGAITIFNGDNWRPFVHVQDVAEGIVAALGAPLHRVNGQIFNLGDSRLNYTLADVADEIRHVFPRSRVEYVSTQDRRNYRVAFDKIRETLGFRGAVGIHEGILEIRRALAGGSVRDYTDLRYNNYEYLQKFGVPVHENAVDAHIMADFQDGPPHLTRTSDAAG
jgi:nucleoside-diphosphate-sugar epimerase